MNKQTSMLVISAAVVVLFLFSFVSTQDDYDFEREPIFIDIKSYYNQLSRALRGAKKYDLIVLRLPLFQKFIDTWLSLVKVKYDQNTCLTDLDYFNNTIDAYNKTSEAARYYLSVIEFDITSESIDACSFANDKYYPKCFMYLGIPRSYITKTPTVVDPRFIIAANCTRIPE